MKRRSFLAAAAGLAATAALPRPAHADAVSDLFAEIARARAGMKTLVGRFAQERTIGLLATAVKSEGELTLVRPDRLRWELFAPDAATYWIGPEGFAYSTPSGGGSTGKAAAGRFGAVLSDLLVFLGGDLESLRARYDFEASRAGGKTTLVAKPKGDDLKKLVARLELVAGAELWRLERTVVEEPSGDRSVMTFTKVDRDVPVDPARMRPSK